ncbi:MAG TPA: DUF4328 domain-containing protein [Pseudonocardia sp.]|uniref:DUF4328 domain-containing protein n=1 Tax=Pseudonocardia sp. TaxID=60912 RepID=UPI002B4B8895|nr:DUF4328 domain-containing protein [Pseudonocardia sp.]HLU58302.1 DUF4328 domain-containing protein [Pseudonocardia sp.]
MTTLSPPRAGRTPLRGLAGVASALVWIAAVPGPTAVFLSSFTFGNHAGSAPAQVGMVLLIGGMVLTGIAGTCAGVVVVVWLRRARAAAAEAGTWPQRWSEGWAVAAWFVPVLNLWVPAAVVSDVARAADPGSDRLRTSCRIWWAAWLGAGFALWIAFVGVPLFGPGAPALIVWFATFSFLSAGFFAVAAATFTQVVRRVTEWHDASRAAATGVLGTAAAATAATTVTAPVPTPGAEAQPERRTEEQAANRAGAEPEADSGATGGGPGPGGTGHEAGEPTSEHAGEGGPAPDAAAGSGPVPTGAEAGAGAPVQAPAGAPVAGPALPSTAIWPLPPGTPPPAQPPAGSSSGRTGLVVAGVAIAAVAVLGIGTALVLADDPPADVVAEAVADAREWSGVNYRGSAPNAVGGPIEYDITVTATGARGTLTRSDGGRAEIAEDASGLLLKGNRQWWQRSQPERADLLADKWVADPGSETAAIEPVLRMDPGELAGDVHPELGSLWEEVGERTVDGEPAVVLSNGFQVLVVTAEEPRRLLLIDLLAPGGREDDPIRVTAITPEEAEEVAQAAERVRIVEAPRTLMQWLVEQPRGDVQINPEPLCTSPSCTATVTVTNTGLIPIVGSLVTTADGRDAGTFPLSLQPGESATFTARTPNPAYNTPGARGEIYWVAQVEPY